MARKAELDNRLSVEIDSEIVVPDVVNVAAYEAYPFEITKDMANDYLKIFFKENKIYHQQPTDVITQEDILKQIEELRDFLERLKNDDINRYEEETDYWNGEIKKLVESLETYPEKYELIPFDGNYETVKKYVDVAENMNPDMQQIKVQGDIGNETPALLNIFQTKPYYDSQLFFLNGSRKNMLEVKLRMDEVGKPIDLDLTLDDAIDLANNYLKELGFDNFYFQDSFYGVHGSGPYVTTSTPAKDTNPYFYDLYFVQKKDEIPLSFTSSFQSGNGSEEYAETWETEVIQIFVDDSGVFSFNWLSPTVLGDKTNESVELLDFSQIKTIILDNLKYVYSLPPYVEHIEKQAIKIDKIEFAYAKCPVINSDEFQLVPCWNVYGNMKTYYANDLQDPNWDEENTETQSVPMGVLLKINAIDGSLI